MAASGHDGKPTAGVGEANLRKNVAIPLPKTEIPSSLRSSRTTYELFGSSRNDWTSKGICLVSPFLNNESANFSGGDPSK